MTLRTIRRAPLKRGMRVLIRVDFNVVLKNGRVLDDFRMRETLPTIRFLLKRGCRVRILAHLGRPNGKKVQGSSLKPIARYFSSLIKERILFIEDPFLERSFRRYDESPDILFFENLRFWPGEEKNNSSFARGLARWGDIYVNEAFSNSHRAHASIDSLAKILPSYAGLQLEKEVLSLGNALEKPRRPFLMVLGGAKVSTKLPLLKRFIKKADRVVIAGAMANTVFLLRGFEIGISTREGAALKSLSRAFFNNKKFIYPVDAVVTPGRPAKTSKKEIKDIGAISSSDFIADVGPRSLRRFIEEAKRAKTIAWNGPLGYTDEKRFEWGTFQFIRALSRLPSFRVVGGGETVGIIYRRGMEKKFTHVSTGGGAMLEFLMGKRLPGITPLIK